MKNRLLLLGALLLHLAHGQTTLFQENFESGSAAWTLNGGSGSNQWVVNAEYAGFSGLINDTPDQPSGITASPESMYLHITNNVICSGLGVCNANFDTGSSSNQSATMTAAISTTGYANVTLTFYYVCAGASGTSYGGVEYSTDNGSSWNSAGVTYSGITNWTQTTISLPAFDNQASLKFRFNWQNGSSGDDPAFSVDQITITGDQGSFASLNTGTLPALTYCNNVPAAFTLPFTVTGTINAGNVYTAELSDANGSFAAPTAIGSMTSSATGTQNLNVVIPNGLSAGSQYRIRVDASDPVTIGTDNGVDLSLVDPPTLSIIALPQDGHICPGGSATLLVNGGTSFNWTPATSLDNAWSQTVSASPSQTTTYTVIGTDGNGCSNTTTFTVTVDNCLGLKETDEQTNWTCYPNPVADKLFIDLSINEGLRSVILTDLSGKIIYTAEDLEPIDMQFLTGGTYLLRIMTEGNCYNKAIIKR